jgi:MFS family permease
MFSPFYISAFAWNLVNGMINMLVPLYALELGMSGVTIGTLVALPIILQLGFNLLGGAYVDRLGPKNILYASCVASALACATYVVSETFAGLLLGQSLSVLGRASFWPASYALGSDLAGDRGANLGRLNSTTNAGQIFGTAAAGVLVGLIGFKATFWVGALDSLVALLLTVGISHEHVKRSIRQPMLATYRSLARIKGMYFGMACAALSVLPFTVTGSFGAILLVSQGFSSSATGWLLALRAIGAIFAGAIVTRVVHSPFDRGVPIGSCAAMAVSLSLMAVTPNAWVIGAALFILGVSSGIVSVYFQLQMAALSPSAQRGSAMSFGGVGWNISNMITPLFMGSVMDAAGVQASFHAIGAAVLAFSVAMVPFYRWAFRTGGRRESR